MSDALLFIMMIFAVFAASPIMVFIIYPIIAVGFVASFLLRLANAASKE